MIFSDHHPLRYLFSELKGVPTMASTQIHRWVLMLSAYNYRIQYKPGPQHGSADVLSRLPLPGPLTEVPLLVIPSAF